MNMAEFGYDVMTLLELQLQLLKTDASSVVRSVIAPGVAVICAAVLAFTSLPLLLFAAASAIHIYAGLPEWSALLIVAGAGFLIAAVVATVSVILIRRHVGVFDRSRDEFIRNVRWVKTVLKTGGGPPKRSRHY